MLFGWCIQSNVGLKSPSEAKLGENFAPIKEPGHLDSSLICLADNDQTRTKTRTSVTKLQSDAASR